MGEIYSLLFTLLLGLFLLLGAGIVFLSKNSDRFVLFSIALAFGVMIMLMITDLIPEAFEAFNDKWYYVLLFVAVGFALLKGLDVFVPHHHDHEGKEDDDDHLSHIGFVSSIALIIHNIIEGMAIYSTLLADFSTGVLVSIGVGLHNIPLGMVIASTLYRANQKKKRTIGIISILALSTFLGGLFSCFLHGVFTSSMIMGGLLSITLGMLIYISFFELMPTLIKDKDKRTSLFGICSGIILIFVVHLFHE